MENLNELVKEKFPRTFVSPWSDSSIDNRQCFFNCTHQKSSPFQFSLFLLFFIIGISHNYWSVTILFFIVRTCRERKPLEIYELLAMFVCSSILYISLCIFFPSSSLDIHLSYKVTNKIKTSWEYNAGEEAGEKQSGGGNEWEEKIGKTYKLKMIKWKLWCFIKVPFMCQDDNSFFYNINISTYIYSSNCPTLWSLNIIEAWN